MFNKQIALYGLYGYTIGIGYSIMIESLTRNKWDEYYENLKYGIFMSPLKPRAIDYFVSLPSVICASIGMSVGYYLR